MSILSKLNNSVSKYLFGDDIFISYSRADGATYAAGLADELATSRRKNAVSEATLITCERNGAVFAVQFRLAQFDQSNREVVRFTSPAGRDSVRSGSHYRRSHSVPPSAVCRGIRDTSNDAYHVAVSVR